MPNLLLSYYGDDFTGSTDVMEALASNGVPTVLFLGIPSAAMLERFKDCRAIGVAGTSRSETPEWMDEHLTPAFAWLKSFGWQPKETELNELRLAANCAKHSGTGSGKQLYGLRPDMFDASKIKMGFDPGYDSLALTDAHVAAFFEAVKQSVPSNLGLAF